MEIVLSGHYKHINESGHSLMINGQSFLVCGNRCLNGPIEIPFLNDSQSTRDAVHDKLGRKLAVRHCFSSPRCTHSTNRKTAAADTVVLTCWMHG